MSRHARDMAAFQDSFQHLFDAKKFWQEKRATIVAFAPGVVAELDLLAQEIDVTAAAGGIELTSLGDWPPAEEPWSLRRKLTIALVRLRGARDMIARYAWGKDTLHGGSAEFIAGLRDGTQKNIDHARRVLAGQVDT